MTPKEKADEICRKMLYQIEWNAQPSTVKGVAKQCALIAVDEIYKLRMTYGQHLEYDLDKINYYSYWEEVKKEIELL